MADRKPRLTRADWLAVGLAVLEEDGQAALAAEPLARRLGTTKGSFYWHFRDVPAFQLEVAAAWAERVVETLNAAPEDEAHTDTLLRLSRPDPGETAMRSWARKEPRVAAIITAVDAARRVALSQTLGELGLTNPEFARIVQAAVIGMETLGDTEPLSTLLAAILALQEA